MPKPPRTNRYIHFRWIPEKFRCILQYITTAQILRLLSDIQPLVICVTTSIDTRSKNRCAPFCFTTDTFLIANPTYIITHYRHHSLRLQTLDRLIKGIPVVHLLLSVRAFTVYTVEPHLMHLTVIGQQLCKLFDKELIVFRRITVAGSITIPRRQVYTEFHAILGTCITKFTYHVTLAVLPRRRSNRMRSRLGWPQAEAVVMLGCKKYHLEATLFQGAYPLVSIQFCRIEQRRIFRTISPFTTGKCINSKMQKGCQLHLLPG